LLGEGAAMLRVTLAALAPGALSALALAVAFVLQLRIDAVDVGTIMVTTTLIALGGSLLLLAPPNRRPEDALEATALSAIVRRTYVGSVGPIDGLQIDRTLVGAQLGTAALGLYSAATAVASLATTLGSGFATVLLPRLAVAQVDPDHESQVVRKWLVASAAVLTVMVIALEVTSRAIIEIAFGREFSPATECARWLILASGFLGYRRILIAILQARDRGAFASWVEIALTPVVVVGIAVAAYADSLVGVALSILFAALGSCLALGIGIFRSSATGSPG
jgi:O-antigen/teichoic acid export membrane protein